MRGVQPRRRRLSAEFQSVPFDPADARAALKQLPERSAVFALYAEAAHAEPYIGRTPNLRGRLERLLVPSAKHPKRLQLAGRVRRIEWRLMGSEFESLLLQFNLLERVYGEKCLDRMHLGAPSFVRFLGSNRYPRLVVTNRPSLREADWAYGPFPSRAAAERFAEETLKLFLLRRCVEELDPNPSHPGCVYSEMKMCLAPCYQGCTDERYAEESEGVERFLATRGESKLVQLKAGREQASANLEFEQAAALHAQVLKAEAVRALASELVRPLSQLRAIILQASAQPGEVALFLYEGGQMRGPAAFSTLGMRIQNEQSGSTSLFAQPLALEAIPENSQSSPDVQMSDQPAEQEDTQKAQTADERKAAKAARGMLETRLEAALAGLSADGESPDATVRQGHLALLKRWYYRPEARRPGEIFFPDDTGTWPLKSILRGVGRVVANSLVPPA
jgi:excinuclease ABC subunit C